MTIRSYKIDLPDDAWDRIDRLAAQISHHEEPVQTLVTVLLDIVQKGVERRRSKEREMVIQCFGEEAMQEATIEHARRMMP